MEKNIDLNRLYDEEIGVISTRLIYSIHRVILKSCTFEELLNYKPILLEKIKGIKTYKELVELLDIVENKKKYIYERSIEILWNYLEELTASQEKLLRHLQKKI